MRSVVGCATAVVASVWLAGAAQGADPLPGEILRRAAAAYQAMQTYQSEGTVVTDIDTGEAKVTTELVFSMLLKKPNLYRISWNEKVADPFGPPGGSRTGAVWSDGTQPYLYLGLMNAYSKMKSDALALGGATGISSGAANTIPSLLLLAFKDQPSLFSRIKNPTLEKSERVGDEECYVLSGPSSYSRKETLWISKATCLVRKYERTLEPPEGGIQPAELSDAEVEQSIRDAGQEVTEERKSRLREMLKRRPGAEKIMGSLRELHTRICSPDLSAEDFRFSLPEGTVLRDRLIDLDTILVPTPKQP